MQQYLRESVALLTITVERGSNKNIYKKSNNNKTKNN